MRNTEYQEAKKKVEPIIILWVKRLYVLAGNIYSWFWLIRQIFVRHSTNFEEYLLWAFLTAGFYWFILEHDDIFFKKQ
jgi:hypothetical protein